MEKTTSGRQFLESVNPEIVSHLRFFSTVILSWLTPVDQSVVGCGTLTGGWGLTSANKGLESDLANVHIDYFQPVHLMPSSTGVEVPKVRRCKLEPGLKAPPGFKI